MAIKYVRSFFIFCTYYLRLYCFIVYARKRSNIYIGHDSDNHIYLDESARGSCKDGSCNC